VATSSAYQRRLEAIKAGSRGLTPEQALAQKQAAEYEAMPLAEKQKTWRREAAPAPLFELGKNIVTGQTVYTNQPAQTMTEADRRLAAFIKSNPSQREVLQGKAKPYGSIESAKMEEVLFPGEPEPASQVPSPTPEVTLPTVKFPEASLAVTPATPKAPGPVEMKERKKFTFPTPSVPPLSELLSPKAKVAREVMQIGKEFGKSGQFVQPGLPYYQTPGVTPALVTPLEKELAKVPGEIAKASQFVQPGTFPIPVSSIAGGESGVEKGLRTVASAFKEASLYDQLEAQVQENAKRRALLGEPLVFALEDERRKARALFQESTKTPEKIIGKTPAELER
jgi:hypothetical protein